MADEVQKSDGKLIFIYFLVFFALIIVVNSIFIYVALGTHSGVVTEQPYEKGLAYNETLAKAKAQVDLEHKVSYRGGVLRWNLPMGGAVVNANIVRPVQDGYDFQMPLKHMGGGMYEANLVLPLKGAWTAKLKAIWDDQQFQTRHDFIAE